MTPEHPRNTRTTPKQHFVVTDEAYLNNPYEKGSDNSRFFEGIKFIFLTQGFVSENNYVHAARNLRWSKPVAVGIQKSHILNGYIEAEI